MSWAGKVDGRTARRRGGGGRDHQRRPVAAGLGVVIGILGAFGLTRLMLLLLIEISATDPLVFLLVGTVLFAAAVVVCLVPALRAIRVDPLVAMRAE